MTNADNACDRMPPAGETDAGEERRSAMALGVIVERRPTRNRWADDQYLPVAVIPNAPAADWAPLDSDDAGETNRWHVGTCDAVLYRTDSEAYLGNLESDRPSVYVVLRPSEDPEDEHPVALVEVTLSPYEAQDYLDIGDDIVEGVPIPEPVDAWVRDFVARHHKETPFKKRKRRPHVQEAPQFGKVLHPVERAFYERRDALAKASDDAEGEEE
jgi:hypothetical protein